MSQGSLHVVHEFVWSELCSVFVCVGCFVRTRSVRRLAALKRLACKPLSALEARRLHRAQSLGHRLYKYSVVGDVDVLYPLIVCTKCGAYGQRQHRSLGEPCLAGKSLANNWRRVHIHHKHPRTNQRLNCLGPVVLPKVWDADVHDLHVLLPETRVMNYVSRTCNLDNPEGDIQSESD